MDKNGFVFGLPIHFCKQVLILYLRVVFIGVLFLFCLVSSALCYNMNLFDIELDKLSSNKKASDQLPSETSKSEAIITIALLFLIVCIFCSLLNIKFILALAAYVILNIAYTIFLKHIVISILFP